MEQPRSKWHAVRLAGFSAFFVLASLLIWQVPTWAHSWYPKECCYDGDCAPVDAVGWFNQTMGLSSSLTSIARWEDAYLTSSLRYVPLYAAAALIEARPVDRAREVTRAYFRPPA